MPRKRPESRIDDVAEAALGVFTARGFARTQVSDIAKAAGLSVGAVYLYATSKEALFQLAFARAKGDPMPARLPLKEKGMARVAAALDAYLDTVPRWPRLKAALKSPGDGKADLRAILGELYDALLNTAPLVNLIDRCVLDLPELAEIYGRRVKGAFIADWTAFVAAGAKAKRLRNDLDPKAAARAAMEAIVWMAMHRPRDLMPPDITPEAARQAAVELGVSALVP